MQSVSGILVCIIYIVSQTLPKVFACNDIIVGSASCVVAIIFRPVSIVRCVRCLCNLSCILRFGRRQVVVIVQGRAKCPKVCLQLEKRQFSRRLADIYGACSPIPKLYIQGVFLDLSHFISNFYRRKIHSILDLRPATESPRSVESFSRNKIKN